MVWGMIKGSRKVTGSTGRRSVRLSLERLEHRDCPSGGGSSSTSIVMPAPIVDTFSASPTNAPGSRQVEVRGNVLDNHPEQDTVSFTGVVAGSVTPDASGNFDFFTIASGLGSVTAVATRSTQVQSAPVVAWVTSAAPVITSFQVIQGPGGCWTFQGTVTDEAPAGIVVQFSGNSNVSGLTATVDQNGNFSATFYLPNLSSGSVSAQCSDVWGLWSNIVTDPIV